MTDVNIEQLGPNAWLVIGGIKWKPLIGSGLASKSQKEAVAVKATHFVAASSQSAAVGTIQLAPEKKSKVPRKFYSAAAIFAISHPTGAVIAREEVRGGKFWVVGSHDGMVSKGTDVICTADEADEIVNDFKRRHSNALLVSGSETDLNHYLNSSTELQPVKSLIEKIPTPVKVAVGFLLCLMLIDTGWGHWKKYKLRQLREQDIGQFVDSHAEWKTSLDEWARTIKTDGKSGLSDLYAEMGRIPLEVGHWKLSESTCKQVARGWSCTARYFRKVNATNLSFTSNLPQGWSAGWDGLTTAVATWEVKATRFPLARAAIPKVGDFSVNYISLLQRVLPTYRKVELLPPLKVVIANPTVVQVSQGRNEAIQVPYPKDNTVGIEIPSIQRFTFNGPLRSLTVLPITDETVIKSLHFSVEDRALAPSMRDSIFMAELIGETYVK
ncbi:hypothetical protein ACEN2T_18085 [Pseudomonas sp. W22_MBD1_FP4]|uniref:hypothetical protein n=1 Tax=Pseudomonas sp. W22_MBD1_FP4 TaxID=3240272 RepID=UPI003F971301